MTPTPEHAYVEIDGLRVHHKVSGTGTPAVLLLHHFHGNVWTWRHVQERLARHTTVVSFDRPGFGLTDRPAHPPRSGSVYTREAAARIAVGLLDHLGIERAVLVGSSAGGTTALEVWHRSPNRVAGLALLSPAVTGDVGPPAVLRPLLRVRALRRVGAGVVRRLGGDIGRERVGRSWAAPHRVTSADVAAYTRPLAEPGWAQALYDLVTAEPPPELAHVLATVDVPALVIAGSNDPIIRPLHNRRTAAALPTARYVELDGCGHTPQEECPDRVVAALDDLLDRVRHGAAPSP